MELYGFMEREKKIPSYFFIITKMISLLLRHVVPMLLCLIRDYLVFNYKGLLCLK